jgi:hypothetical protein
VVGRTSPFLFLALPYFAHVAHVAVMVVTVATAPVAAAAALVVLDDSDIVIASTAALTVVIEAAVGVAADADLMAVADGVRLTVKCAIDLAVATVDSALFCAVVASAMYVPFESMTAAGTSGAIITDICILSKFAAANNDITFVKAVKAGLGTPPEPGMLLPMLLALATPWENGLYWTLAGLVNSW